MTRKRWFLPETPDVLGMLRRQMAVTIDGVDAFALWAGGDAAAVQAVRDALGLTKGTQLKVELDGSRIILRKSVDDAISRVRGRFKLDGFASVDEAMRAVRGRAPGDPLDQ